MIAVRRMLACALVALGTLAAGAAPALAHATLRGSTPAADGRSVQQDTARVTLRFSEPVELVNPSDVTVVDGRGRRVDSGAPRTAAGDQRSVVVPLRGPLLPDSYTVRYQVASADSHAAVEAFVFAVGRARLGSPILAGSGGLSDASPASVGARAAEFAALMLLLGLLAFRVLVWAPAVATARGLGPAERERALRRGQQAFWRAFWASIVVAGLAETLVLAAKSAVVFHTGLVAAALHPASAYRLVSASRFGDLLGWRCGALCALAAVAFVVWTAEAGGQPSSGRRGSLAPMALLAVAALTLLAAQGHASQAPLAPLSIAFDVAHLTAVSIWMGGLVCLVAVLVGARRAPAGGGRALASATLSRFSRRALWAVVVIAASGLARAIGELSSPGQLLDTGYGRSLMLKASLLAPILVLARRNRSLVEAFAGGLAPTRARLRAIARSLQVELALAMGIVLVAAVLVAQIPGRA